MDKLSDVLKQNKIDTQNRIDSLDVEISSWEKHIEGLKSSRATEIETLNKMDSYLAKEAEIDNLFTK